MINGGDCTLCKNKPLLSLTPLFIPHCKEPLLPLFIRSPRRFFIPSSESRCRGHHFFIPSPCLCLVHRSLGTLGRTFVVVVAVSLWRSQVAVHYIGKLKNGKIFDSTTGGKPFKFCLGMRVGDKRKLTIPPSMGYGNKNIGQIPTNSWLIFDVELVSVN